MSQGDKSDSIYLHDVPLQQAWSSLVEALEAAGLWKPLGIEEIPLDKALGRVTAEPIWAKTSSPHYHAAAMDGYALRAVDTRGASDRTPVTLHIDSEAIYIDTGDVMPHWADAVVPIEVTEPVGEVEGGRAKEAILIRAALAPWSHVRPMGEDMVATELVLPSGHELKPVDIGAVAASGYDSIRVWRQPRVAIIPSGTELINPGDPIEPGKIIEYNSLVLAAQVASWGGTATRYPIVPDHFQTIKEVVARASRSHDLVLVNAGSSAGSEDFTADVVRSLGELLVHGVAVRPGHPVILGMINRVPEDEAESQEGSVSVDEPPIWNRPQSRRIPVIGVPGYPVSAALTGEIFVEPLLACWRGRPSRSMQTIEATLTRKVHSSLGDDEYLRVTVGRVGDRLVAAPLTRGAGVITSLVRADGIVLIPAGIQGIQAGEKVSVRLYRSIQEIEDTILAIGSHDLTIDLIAQFLSARGRRLSSANLGSLGGLIALQRGEAHLAGSHLLDPESGEYNLPYIQQYMPNIPVIVITLVTREQGLIVPRGNPKKLKGLEDLAQPGVTFVNRQRGAGTRLLLDYHLGQLDLGPDSIDGYQREEFTHLAVAAAIASERADCGLGIRAAANALNLDFIPLFNERYDLVIPKKHYQSTKLAPLIGLLDDAQFQQAAASLPGYDTSPMGRIVAELE